MPRVLVTGGAGFIGSHLARSLLDAGHEVHVVDDLSTGSRANVPPGAPLYRLNLIENGFTESLPSGSFDAVMHLAGQSSGEKSFDSPRYDFDANARSTSVLAAWAVENEVPVFLHASSMGVYGQPPQSPVAETAPVAPLSWYGGSKAAAEMSLRAAAAQGVRVCSFRMFSVYGPGQDMEDLRQGMVSIFLSYLLKGEPVLVKGRLDRMRDFVYVDDVVRAWRAALERDVSGPFNLGTGVGTTVGDLITMLIEASGLPAEHPIEAGEGTPGDQHALWADIERARAQLGWEPEMPLPDGIAALVAWARGD